MNPREKISALQNLLRQHSIDVWIVPSSDPHQSEYVADRWRTRAWLSGFYGSAGTLIVTQDSAGLWVDPRYHIRGAKETAGSGIELFKEGLPDTPKYVAWLKENLPEDPTIGFDGSVVSLEDVEALKTAFQDQLMTLEYDDDLMELLWHDRPEAPQEPIFLHDDQFAGESRIDKFTRVRSEMKKTGADAHLITSLDDIAWLFNIRGNDVKHNPVAIAYAVITSDDVWLFIDAQKVSDDSRQILQADQVNIAAYDDIYSYWQDMPEDTLVFIDPEKTSYKLDRYIREFCDTLDGKSIPSTMKLGKNSVELEGMRQSHIQDGVAMVKWLYWLEHVPDLTVHTEVTISDKLHEFRQARQYFHDLSFATITGYGANSAVGHYSPHPDTSPQLKPEGILLNDSGGQYLNGTTDITRTMTLSDPSDKQKHVFTTVLKSLIKLSSAIVPDDAFTSQLDAIARDPLWQAGYKCRHGIGHGVGSFLNVHEWPLILSPKRNYPIEAGMVYTVEPGVYFEDDFGIRLENVVIIVEHETDDFGIFYAFETVTLCPIDLNLIDRSIMTDDEIDWLNDYHAEVYEKLEAYLSDEERDWLRDKTRAI